MTSIGERAFMECDRLTSVAIPNSVTSVEKEAFYGCDGLTSLTIGSEVKSIGEYAFSKCEKIENVYAMSWKALKCDINIFSQVVYDNATLFVPEGGMESYEKTAPWYNFYIQSNPTSIEDVEVNKLDKPDAPVYNLKGVKLQNTDNLPKGIYIINGKKIMVR